MRTNRGYLFRDFKKDYLFIHERHTERGRETGRGRSRLPAGEPDAGLDPGTWGHSEGRRCTAEPPGGPPPFRRDCTVGA